jgi:hypothetical protein
MGDENKVAETIKAVEGVVKAVPIYQDAIQPAAKEVGVTLHTAAKCVNIALAPVSALVWGYDKIRDFVNTRVAEKLARIPQEKIVTPRPEVAGPVLEALRYTGHDDDLRELYANLLATAMDADTVANAHPGFVEIIKNLSPDEAKIMRLFAVRGEFPVVDLRTYDEKKPAEYTVWANNLSFIGKEAGCAHQHLTRAYIDNLCRVRLLEITTAELAAPNTYEPLEADPMLEEAKSEIERLGRKFRFVRKVLMRTV